MARSAAHDLFDLTGKTAVVTGGNGGIGLGFARGLAKQGADVMIWGRNETKNLEAETNLREFGGEVHSQVVDVGEEDAVVQAMRDAVARFGRIDCVIANAGVFTPVPSIVEMDASTYHDVLRINLHGAVWTLREGARHMVERAQNGDPGGSMIICGSLSSFLGVAGMLPYATSKGALVSVMHTMACELGQYGIRVNLVAPGLINASGNPERESHYAPHIARTPMGRVGYLEDHEAIAAYLASDGAAYHTGDILVLDGGFSINGRF